MSSIPFNAEQIMRGKNFEIEKGDIGAQNMNADLGLQYTIENILYPEILVQRDQNGREKPTFVIITSGHAIAGLASLAKLGAKKSDGKRVCLFDTSIYMPMGTWETSTRINVATQGVATWGQTIANAKKQCASYSGGVVVVLNGHRGDVDINHIDSKAANINAEKVFGNPDEFVKNLIKRGLGRVVVITETMVNNPSKSN